MSIQEITSADFEEIVLKSTKPVLVDFNATTPPGAAPAACSSRRWSRLPPSAPT